MRQIEDTWNVWKLQRRRVWISDYYLETSPCHIFNYLQEGTQEQVQAIFLKTNPESDQRWNTQYCVSIC